MNRKTNRRPSQRAWRAFSPRDGVTIEQQLRDSAAPCCPVCGAVLETRPATRLSRSIPLDARGYDLDCRGCRRFWCVVQHTARSLRLVRMRRLAAAVRAVEMAAPAPRPGAARDPVATV